MALLKELIHRSGIRAGARESFQSQQFHYCPQCVLVMERRVHFDAGNHALPNYRREYLALIVIVPIIERDEHDAVSAGLEV